MWVQWSPVEFLWHPVGEGMVAPVHGRFSIWLVYTSSNIDGLIRGSLGYREARHEFLEDPVVHRTLMSTASLLQNMRTSC